MSGPSGSVLTFGMCTEKATVRFYIRVLFLYLTLYIYFLLLWIYYIFYFFLNKENFIDNQANYKILFTIYFA